MSQLGSHSRDFAAHGACLMGRNLVNATARVRPIGQVLLKLLPSRVAQYFASFSFSASRSATSARTERARAQRESISRRETTLQCRVWLCRFCLETLLRCEDTADGWSCVDSPVSDETGLDPGVHAGFIRRLLASSEARVAEEESL